jgi:polysaccharide pyruvyl transferase CsaB
MTSRTRNAASRQEVRLAFEHALGAKRSVLLIGGYGCGNVGDEAILSVLLGELRDAGAHTTVVSADPPHTRRMHGIDAVAARPWSLLASMLRADTVIIGGGGIFSRYMGRRSMLLSAVALAAWALRKRVLFRAIGAYRGTPRLVLRALALAIGRASFASARDDATIETLDDAGVTRAIIREPDPALRLAPQRPETVLSARAVGIAVRRVRDEATQERLSRAFVELIDALVEAGLRPVLLPFCRHPSQALEQDADYARELRRMTRDPARCRIIDSDVSPAQMRGLVAELDALVAMRFHAIVFGHSAGVPMTAIPYDDKCASFVDEHRIDAIEPQAVTADALLDRVLPATRAPDAVAA